MKLTAVRTAAARAAAKAKADEDEAKKAGRTSEEMESAEDEDETDTEASEGDDCDTDDDTPPPPKKKTDGKKAAAGAVSPRAAEKARIKAIMGADEAEGREELAEHLAYDTDMSAKAAIAMLSKAPQAAVQAVEATERAGRGDFRAAMAATARGDGKLGAAKGKGGAPKATEDMTDDEFTASVIGFAAKYGLAKA